MTGSAALGAARSGTKLFEAQILLGHLSSGLLSKGKLAEVHSGPQPQAGPFSNMLFLLTVRCFTHAQLAWKPSTEEAEEAELPHV